MNAAWRWKAFFLCVCVCVFFTLYSSGEILLCSHSPVAHHASLHIQAGSRENILLSPKSYCAVISGLPVGRGNIPLQINILEAPICTNGLFPSPFFFQWQISTCCLTLQPSATTLKTQKIQPLLHFLSCGIRTAGCTSADLTCRQLMKISVLLLPLPQVERGHAVWLFNNQRKEGLQQSFGRDRQIWPGSDCQIVSISKDSRVV